MLLISSKHFTSADISADLEKKLGLLGLHATTNALKWAQRACYTYLNMSKL